MAREWPDYVHWIHELPCFAESMGGCQGYVEAHHAGPRGLSRRAHDDTCVPLCSIHHKQFEDASGPFKTWKQIERRRWTARAIWDTRVKWADTHTEQPAWSLILEVA
jgi:hypothetical protein